MSAPNVDDLLRDLATELTAVRPSAGFHARVRDRIQPHQEQTAGFRVLGWAAVALAVFAAATLMSRPPAAPVTGPSSAAVTSRAPVAGGSARPSNGEGIRIDERPAPVTIASRPTPSSPGGSSMERLVVASPDQLEILNEYLRRRREHRSTDRATTVEPLPEIAPIEIAPIAIEPLPGTGLPPAPRRNR